MTHLHPTQWSVTAKIYRAFFSSYGDKLKFCFEVYYSSKNWGFVGCALCGFGAYPLMVSCDASADGELGFNYHMRSHLDSDLSAFEARHEWKTYDRYVYMIYMCIIWKYLENLLNSREFGKFLLEDST